MNENHEAFQAVVEWWVWLSFRQVQDDKKSWKLEDIQESGQDYQEVFLQQ